jgi:pimeloyl-ACP methyl ester carboxylesterase
MSGGSPPVVLVGHSMGGMPITAAGEAMPQKIRKLVYLAALMLPPGKPLVPYMTSPEAKDGLVPKLAMGVPANARAGRIDPRSMDPDYRVTMKEAFFADVSDEQAEAAANLLQPDFPNVGAPIMTTAQRWGSIPRAYILTEQDRAVVPALQRRCIREVDEAMPTSKTDVRLMTTSHSPFLSKPADLAKILIELAA